MAIMYVAGGVSLWTCGPMGREQNMYHVCNTRLKFQFFLHHKTIHVNGKTTSKCDVATF